MYRLLLVALLALACGAPADVGTPVASSITIEFASEDELQASCEFRGHVEIEAGTATELADAFGANIETMTLELGRQLEALGANALVPTDGVRLTESATRGRPYHGAAYHCPERDSAP